MKIKTKINVENGMTMEDIIGQINKDCNYKFVVRDGAYIVNAHSINVSNMTLEHIITKDTHIQQYYRDHETDNLYCIFSPITGGANDKVMVVSKIPDGETF